MKPAADITGFRVAAAGTYRVSYRLNVGASLLGGGVQVYVDGVPFGPSNPPLVALGTTLFDTLLVTATAPNQVIDLRYGGAVLGVLSVGASSSIEIERVN